MHILKLKNIYENFRNNFLFENNNKLYFGPEICNTGCPRE